MNPAGRIVLGAPRAATLPGSLHQPDGPSLLKQIQAQAQAQALTEPHAGLYGQQVPQTVENFLSVVRAGSFAGSVFNKARHTRPESSRHPHTAARCQTGDALPSSRASCRAPLRLHAGGARGLHPGRQAGRGQEGGGAAPARAAQQPRDAAACLLQVGTPTCVRAALPGSSACRHLAVRVMHAAAAQRPSELLQQTSPGHTLHAHAHA